MNANAFEGAAKEGAFSCGGGVLNTDPTALGCPKVGFSGFALKENPALGVEGFGALNPVPPNGVCATGVPPKENGALGAFVVACGVAVEKEKLDGATAGAGGCEFAIP